VTRDDPILEYESTVDLKEELQKISKKLGIKPPRIEGK